LLSLKNLWQDTANQYAIKTLACNLPPEIQRKHGYTQILNRIPAEIRKDVFIVDDSLFDRSRSRKVELLVIVFSRYMRLSAARLEEFTASFIKRFPKYMQEALERKGSAI